MLQAVGRAIESKLETNFELAHLSVENESSSHNVAPGSETHFKVVLVAEEFADLNLLARHRRVNEVLNEELVGPVHALSIHTYTEAEWRDRFGSAPLSPPCHGGSAAGE